MYSKIFRPRGRAFWSSQLLVYLCGSFLTALSWYTGADFAGQASAGWSSGAKSLTSAGVASAFNEGKDNGAWGKGMFGKYLIADPSYSGADGGFGGNASLYPLDGNYLIPMCGSSVCVCTLSGQAFACLSGAHGIMEGPRRCCIPPEVPNRPADTLFRLFLDIQELEVLKFEAVWRALGSAIRRF